MKIGDKLKYNNEDTIIAGKGPSPYLIIEYSKGWDGTLYSNSFKEGIPISGKKYYNVIIEDLELIKKKEEIINTYELY